jgi:nicotinamidase-related amidase
LNKGIFQRRFAEMPEIVPSSGDTALIIIDMQYLDAHEDYGMAKKAKEEGKFDLYEHLFDQLPTVITNIARLQRVCRKKKIEVIFVKIQSYTQDGRDLSPSYKIKGMKCPPGSREAEILEELRPIGDEIVLTKLCTSAFVSTPIDQVLRYMGIRKLLVTGVNTNYCVESFVRGAYDRGYEVVLVEDCCTTVSEKYHKVTCEEIDNIFCKVCSLDGVLDAIDHGLAL